MAARYEVRRTDYGYGIWDTRSGDWWISRQDMTRLDAERLAAELNSGEAANRATDT